MKTGHATKNNNDDRKNEMHRYVIVETTAFVEPGVEKNSRNIMNGSPQAYLTIYNKST